MLRELPASMAQLDAHPTGDQEVAGSTPAEVGNILSGRLIMKYTQQNLRATLCKFPYIQTLAGACITKTCLYNFVPLKPHLYIVKLGFTGVYLIVLISA